MSNIWYTKEHEWVCREGQSITIGISQHAQEQLGDIVFVDLPEIGKQIHKGAEALALESTKAAASVYAPVNGVVCQVNELLVDQPDMVNSDPQGEGWMIKLNVTDLRGLDELMDQATYENYLDSLT